MFRVHRILALGLSHRGLQIKPTVNQMRTSHIGHIGRPAGHDRTPISVENVNSPVGLSAPPPPEEEEEEEEEEFT